MVRITVTVCVFVGVLLATPGGRQAQADTDRASNPVRVLFVGNSQTRYNNLPRLVRQLYLSSGERRARMDMVTMPGSTIRRHWLKREARQKIRRGYYSHVVLQGHSRGPLDRPDELATYMSRFTDVAKQRGANVLLYNTWARRPRGSRPETVRQTQGVIDDFYGRMGSSLSAKVAPVGAAWLLARSEMPSVELYRSDGIHPSLAGSYLTACVFYGVITGRSPEALPYVPYHLPRRAAAQLQSMAAVVLRARQLVH